MGLSKFAQTFALLIVSLDHTLFTKSSKMFGEVYPLRNDLRHFYFSLAPRKHERREFLYSLSFKTKTFHYKYLRICYLEPGIVYPGRTISFFVKLYAVLWTAKEDCILSGTVGSIKKLQMYNYIFSYLDHMLMSQLGLRSPGKVNSVGSYWPR